MLARQKSFLSEFHERLLKAIAAYGLFPVCDAIKRRPATVTGWVERSANINPSSSDFDVILARLREMTIAPVARPKGSPVVAGCRVRPRKWRGPKPMQRRRVG